MSDQLHENFEARHEAYLLWLTTPADARGPQEPMSKRAYAKRVGVTETTLRNWEAKPWFKEEWRKRVNALAGAPERTQQLLDALFAKGLSGDTRAASLFLQATGQLQTKIEVEQTPKSARELTDEQLDALIAERAVAEKKLRAVS